MSMYQERFLSYDELCAWFGEDIKESDLCKWNGDGYLVVERTPKGNRYKLSSVIKFMNAHYPVQNIVVYSHVYPESEYKEVNQLYKRMREALSLTEAKHFVDVAQEGRDLLEARRLLELACAGRVQEIIVATKHTFPVITVTSSFLESLRTSKLRLTIPCPKRECMHNYIRVECDGCLVKIHFPSRFAPSWFVPFSTSMEPTKISNFGSTAAPHAQPVYAPYGKLGVSVTEKVINAWVKAGHVKSANCDGVLMYDVADVQAVATAKPVTIGYLRGKLADKQKMKNMMRKLYEIEDANLYMDLYEDYDIHKEIDKQYSIIDEVMNRIQFDRVSRIVFGKSSDMLSLTNLLVDCQELGIEVVISNHS